MNHITTTERSSGFRRRLGMALGAGLLLVGLAAATASAKEVTTGGTVTPVAPACQPVTSLTAKGDPKVAETGLASIAVTYGVKPCVNGQAVTVAVTVAEYADRTAVIWDDQNAPVNGKFTAFGVKLRTSYIITVAVYDAATSELVGQLSAFAAAVPKGV